MQRIKWLFALILIGSLSGYMAVCFRKGLFFLNARFISLLQVLNVQYQIAPVLTNILTSCLLLGIAWCLVRRVPEANGSGIPHVYLVLSHKVQDRWWKVIPVKLIGGLSALSAGLLVGREGPIIQLGSNVGSMTAWLLRYSAEKKDMLMLVGAAAGLAATFQTPIAAVFFIVEAMGALMVPTRWSVGASAIASLIASVVVRWLSGVEHLLPQISLITPPIQTWGWFIALGGLLGGMSWCFNVSLMATARYVKYLSPRQHMLYLLLIGVVVGTLRSHHPEFVGQGFGIIDILFDTPFSLQLIMAYLLGRFVLGLGSYATLVPGGVFAPLLALGALSGVASHQLLNACGYGLSLDPKVFMVAGMGGLVAGPMRTPLTATLLLMEMLHDIHLFFPLLLTCFTASWLMRQWGQKSIYEQLLVFSTPTHH